MICQLHQLLLELIPGAKKALSAAQAKALLASIRPRDAAGKARATDDLVRRVWDSPAARETVAQYVRKTPRN